MRAVVPAEVDAVARARDAPEQRVDERVLGADERENRPVVILVDVNVEQLGVLRHGGTDRVQRRRVATFREVGNRLERKGH